MNVYGLEAPPSQSVTTVVTSRPSETGAVSCFNVQLVSLMGF